MQTLHQPSATQSVLPPQSQTLASEQAAVHEPGAPSKMQGKRLVSKRRYAANVGKKVALSSASLGFLLVASFAAVGALAFLTVFLSPAKPQSDFGQPHEAPPFIWGFGVTALMCYFLAWRTLSRVSQVETGVPLTRANTADLPAPESLVRASEEPREAQEAVLLRATSAQTNATPTEQLVRPVGGQE